MTLENGPSGRRRKIVSASAKIQLKFMFESKSNVHSRYKTEITNCYSSITFKCKRGVIQVDIVIAVGHTKYKQDVNIYIYV